ncbi:hypothetical protein GCM10022376_12710 [Yimella lutea]|uniref:hypothetical protein n=1 Tax=Yimella lutea TaxID=587872 RepID=UPI0031E9FF3C
MNTKAWSVTPDVSVAPSQQGAIDAAFDEFVAPSMSSGWVCTLTIECGTFVCACR